MHARWCPDGRGILATSSFQLKITFWSLVTKHSESLQWPKLVMRGVSFSHDGKFAAVATRRDCKDFVNILTSESWELVTRFEVGTADLADLAWAPDDGSIAVWDSILDHKVRDSGYLLWVRQRQDWRLKAGFKDSTLSV